jgi:Peptidase C39 family
MRSRWRSLVVTAAVAVAVTQDPRALAQSRNGVVRLLDVPFLAQSEMLCGGAAAAMVMRFWGSHDLYADAFSTLIDAGRGGIRGEDLVRALQQRGWNATTFRGTQALVAAQLEMRRPPIVLIEDRPGRFHYVVIVGWTDGHVVLHDPARAPFRIVEQRAFARAWETSGFWTLLILPPAVRPAAGISSFSPTAALRSTGSDSCQAIVDEGVRLANAGDVDAARHLLELAADACPAAAGPHRELAGLHALKGEWALAAADARTALARDAADEHSSRILATSQFMSGQTDSALAAWNTVGEPRLDLVRVRGLERIRYAVVERAIGLTPRTTLTVADLVRARRRVSDLPGIAGSRVSFTPGVDGRADLDVAVIERSPAPIGSLQLAATGVRAFSDREIVTGFANPTGGGELFTASWRWWEHRPRAALTFTAPSPSNRFGGTWTLSLFTDRQTYGQEVLVEEARRGASFRVADWATGGLRWQAGIGVDRWTARGLAMSLEGGLQQLLWDDRLTLAVHAEAIGGAGRTGAAGLSARYRSTPHNEGVVWLAGTGFDVAGASAPLSLWPGAGTGQGRETLLRAHPLLEDGIIRGGVFGRRLLYANGEWRRWIQPTAKPLKIAPAIFIDVARAARGLEGSNQQAQADIGAGLRLSMAGMGVLRLDVARGTRDGATALSFGWERRR